MMTSAHVVDTSVNVTINSPQDYTHPDDHTSPGLLGSTIYSKEEIMSDV